MRAHTDSVRQPNSVAVPYCQQAPKNSELNGLFQCQFQGANQQTFVGGLAVGAPGTIPFGHTTPLSPAGSCAANPSGPIADGSQLTDITSDPGLQNISGSSSSGSSTGSSKASSSAAAAPAATSTAAAATSTDSDCSDDDETTTTTVAAPAATSAAASTGSSSGSFQLQNGKDAQALNAKFATLTADA